MRYKSVGIILLLLLFMGCLSNTDESRTPGPFSKTADECSVNCFGYNEIESAYVGLENGEVLCSLRVGNLSDSMTFNQTGARSSMLEYEWIFVFDEDKDNIDDYRLGFMYKNDGSGVRRDLVSAERLTQTFWVRTGDNQYGIPLFKATFEIQGNNFVFRISKGDSDKSVEEFMRSNIWVETYSNDSSHAVQKTLRINFKSKYETPI